MIESRQHGPRRASAASQPHGRRAWPSYAVVWRDQDGPLKVGGAEVGPRCLRLAGTGPGGHLVVCELAYHHDLVGVRIGRAPEERLQGRPALVLELRDQAPLELATMNGPGTLNELAELIARLLSDARRNSTRCIVIVPLKKGAWERARALIEEGPPFDPQASGLERHQVFLGDRDVVFVFEGRQPREALERLLLDPVVWHAAAAWQSCIAGRPRFATDLFSWVKKKEPETAAERPRHRSGGTA